MRKRSMVGSLIGNSEFFIPGESSRLKFNFELPLKILFDHSSDGVFLTTKDGRVFVSNYAASEILGWSEEELCRLGCSDIIDQQDGRLNLALDIMMRKGTFEGVIFFKHKSGILVEVDVSSKIFRDLAGDKYTLTIFRQRASQQIRNEKSPHDPACGDSNSESSRVGVATLSRNGLIRPQNNFFYLLLGLEKSSGFASFPFRSVFASDDEHQEITKHIKSSVLSISGFEVDAIVKRGDGEKFQARIMVKPVDTTAKNGSFLVFLEDISDHKRSDPCFVYDETPFEKFVQNIPAAVSIRDRDGKLVLVNNKWLAHFGPHDVTWKGIKINKLFPSDLSYFIAQTDKICLEQETPLEYVVAVRDNLGVVNFWQTRKFPCSTPDGETLVCGMAININDQVKLEKALIHLRLKYDHLLKGLTNIYKRMQKRFA